MNNSPAIVISDWKPLARNSLRGFFTATMPSGIVFHEIAAHTSNGKKWVSPPSKPMMGRDGVALKDENGKIKYSQMISFSDKAVRDKWSAAVVAALDQQVPGAFNE